MNKYKAGESIVLDILEIVDDGYYRVGNEDQYWWLDQNDINNVAEPLTDYTGPLQNKISNQRKGITSLLKKNADLKRENAELEAKYEALRKALNEFNKRVDDMCNTARTAGEEAAWELAGKLLDMDYADFKKIFGITSIKNIINQGYTEVATKVAEWEKAKEEIHVGDVFSYAGGKCVVTSDFNGIFTLLWDDGSSGNHGEKQVREYKKVGHIDVDAWLAQIGGEE